jgi:hypothetical protein
MHRKVAAALVAVLALGVASCGDSGGEPLARAELVRRIERVCRDAQRDAQRALRRAGTRDDGGVAFVSAIATSTSTVVDRLGELEPAGGVANAFNAFKDGMEERDELLSRLEGLRGAELQREMRAIEDEATRNGERIQAAGTRLGVEGCI